MTSTPPPPAPVGEQPVKMSPAYRAAWELFVDWCTTTGHTPLPAGSSTVLAFLHDCPAAPATQALRVRAITTAHTHAGHPAPPRTPEILDVLRGRARRPDPRIPLPPGHVDQLLTALPIHGWTQGWFGRRDRALLVLADTALTYRAIAELTVGDIYFTPAGASVHSGNDVVELPVGTSPVRCRPCALALWIDALQLAATSATVRVARTVHRAAPLTADSPHRCRQPVTITDGALPLLPAANPWGQLDLQPAPITRRTVSRLARNDEPRNHRHHPPPAGESPTPPPAAPPPRVRLEPLDSARAAAVRNATAAALAPLTVVLDDLDAAAVELERKSVALLKKFVGE
ncbi:hypothetical protein FDO65_19475 [Nakamurella flava]|uniref:Integrase n=1 Tax=Nakamurella flava TaxID=2576308 RepID=A0A4U6QAN8_9ACTN|nr:hypothetical protein [Nakamurella flava]TKV57000.1 hypothetical protein FDO65_19475 [Nakamurella flava]